MEVREGYKKTEIGIIPEDWDIQELQYISKIIDSLHQTPKFSNEGYAMVRVSDIKTGNLSLSKTLKVNEDIFLMFTNNYIPKRNDIVLSRVGSYGVSSFVNQDEPFCMGQNTVVIVPKLNNKYIYFSLNSNAVKNQIENESFGTGYKSLSLKNIKELSIPLPPLPEQKAISEVLSDTDNLIQALEKRIAKKRLIKQGAMQKLLTPREGWEVKKLGEIGKTYGGLSGKSKKDFEKGKCPYIPFMNIMSNPVIDTTYLDYVNIEIGESQNQTLKDDLFFNGSSETPEEVWMCSVLLKDIPNLYLNSFCFGFRLDKELKTDGLYLSYFFRSSEGRKLFYSLAQGATRYNLSKSNFLKMEILLPPYEEQTRIATILSDMDKEIETLEKKVSKYKLLKQGLMQNLLTGKMRLI